MTLTQQGRIYDAANWGFSHKEISRFVFGKEERVSQVRSLLCRRNIKVTDYRNRQNKESRWVSQRIKQKTLPLTSGLARYTLVRSV